MKKIKIAFCVRDMKIGGVESVLIRTLDELVKNKHLELFVVTYAKVKEPVYLDWFAAHPNVHLFTLYPSRWLGTDLAHFFLLRLMQHWCRDVYRWWLRVLHGLRGAGDIDLYVDYYNFSFNSEFKNVRKPKIAWWHASINTFVSGKYIRYMKNYDMMVALTDGFTDEFKKIYPEYADKVMRIYNPLDLKSVAAASDVAVRPRGKYFSCVSRLYADKDIPTVLRAFDIFWNQNNRPNVKLFIIGGGSFREKYEQLAGTLSAGKNIIFTGPLANPFGYMRGAMANILSSFSEGLPTVLVESAAVGRVNIASDCKNGPREILFDGAGGLLFRPGNADELAACMSDVYNEKIDVRKMQKLAREGLARFDADVISEQILALIKSYV